MKDTEYKNLLQFRIMGGGLVPENEAAFALMEHGRSGDLVLVKDMTGRDLAFHKCYFSLLRFIYGYLPSSFKSAIADKDFHTWLKHLQGKYRVLFAFRDGTKMVEYESISFGKMSQARFEAYVQEQLPFIYSDVIGKYFEGRMYDDIVATIEQEYEKFLGKL